MTGIVELSGLARWGCMPASVTIILKTSDTRQIRDFMWSTVYVIFFFFFFFLIFFLMLTGGYFFENSSQTL